jgi:hypothetical protein
MFVSVINSKTHGSGELAYIIWYSCNKLPTACATRSSLTNILTLIDIKQELWDLKHKKKMEKI